jgi:hypothetical protein
MSEHVWVIYDRPPDFPNHVVVRASAVADGKVHSASKFTLYDTVDDARAALRRRGLTCVLGTSERNPYIVEAWA